MPEEQNTNTLQHDNTDASGDETLLTGGDQTATTDETLLTGKKEEATGAPDTYADFKLPENQSVSDDFVEYAKGQNWTQEQAQSALERDLTNKKATVEAFEAQQADEMKAVKKGWLDEVMADKEIGGDNHKKVMAGAKQVYDQFGSKELSDLLNQTGLGNHPEVIRLFHNIRNAISEDTFVDGTNSLTQKFVPGDAGRVERFYN